MDDNKLIEEVRNRPFIWDKNDKRHCDRGLTAVAWDTIAKEMGGVTSSECKNRWTNIKDYFLRKDKEMRYSNSSLGAVKKKKKWHLYDSLLFLVGLPATSSGPASGIGNLPGVGDDSNLYTYDVKEEFQHKVSASPTSVQSEESFVSEGRETLLPVHTVPELPRKRKMAKGAEMSEIDRKVLKVLAEPEKTDVDDNEHFFKSILSSLKNLDELETMQFRLDVQQLVLDYLLKARARKIAAPSRPLRPKSDPSNVPSQGNSTTLHNTSSTFQTSSEDSTLSSR